MINRNKLLERFREEYQKLNKQQKAAVDQIEGPVMVIAGPGTGKTQILSVRIGKILLDTDAHPSNILCLTYTDAGVVAMRKRLLSMIGPDAYSVPVHTFHSFCNMVIQQHAHLFHRRDMQPVSELETAESLMQLIDGLEEGNPLKRYKSDAYYEAASLKNLFSTMKREGWTPAFLHLKIDEYAQIIPEKFYNKVKARKGIMELTAAGHKELERLEKLRAAVGLFDAYQAILRERQRYDYDDMINWVIAVFESYADVLALYREQFQYLLVDEYQDTSGSQNRLVELLSGYWEIPNLFVVGDDDQSIYRFQGANMENMLLMAKRHHDHLLRVVLTENYRSVQPVLDAAHQLIGNNTRRLISHYDDLSKTLTAARHGGTLIRPVIRRMETSFDENIMVASEIGKLLEEGVYPGRIAVIYKEHKSGDELQKFLTMKGIPFYAKKTVNLLEDSFIRQVTAYIRWVVAEKDIPFSGDPLLFRMLHHEFHRLPPLKIAAISHEVNTMRRGSREKHSVRQYLGNLSEQHSGKLFTGDELTDSLVGIHRMLENLVSASENMPLLRWLELLFNEAGILSWILSQPEKGRYMCLLNGFFDYVQEECRRKPDLDTDGLVRLLKLLDDNDIAIPLVQTSGNDNGVNLLTCHGSKGLEFEYVFMTGCHSALWEGKRNNNRGYRIPPNVFTAETDEEKEEELRRLFFVAVTRAEKYLYISYPCFSNEGRQLEPTRFIAEMEGLDPAVDYPIPSEMKLQFSALRFGIISRPSIEKAEREFIEQLLVNFKMNVTALNNFLECPVRFYYTSLVRVPAPQSESAQFGSSMHDALSFFYTRMMESDRQYPPKEVLLNRFRRHITSHREVFTAEALERYANLGASCLSAFYDRYFQGVSGEFIRTEVNMEALFDSIPLKGIADRIQYWGNDVIITDFKTGSAKKSNGRKEFATPGEPGKEYGGNYWRQAVFYKILFEQQRGNSAKNLKAIQFHYVEPNEQNEFDIIRVSITPEHEEIVAGQIREAWNRIQAHDFYTGCGKPECDWCNFVKDHKIYHSLTEADEQEQPVVYSGEAGEL